MPKGGRNLFRNMCVVTFRPGTLCSLKQSWALNVDNKPIWRSVLPCVGYKVIQRLFADKSVTTQNVIFQEKLLTFRRRIKSRLPIADIIRRLSYSSRF